MVVNSFQAREYLAFASPHAGKLDFSIHKSIYMNLVHIDFVHYIYLH
jgi:hypothetical protein